MNRVFLTHGWEGNPNNHWFPWLRMELVARGWEVNAPQMPTGTRMYADKERRYTQIPKVKEWLEFLKGYVGKPNEETYFVGHSLGCIAIARYLAGLNSPFVKGNTASSQEGILPFVKGVPPSSAGRDLTTPASQDGGTPFVKGDKSSVSLPALREQAGRTRPPSFSKGGIKVGGCVFVAGFSGRLEIPQIREFYELPFDPEKAKQHCDKFVMIFSDNDPYVPVAKSLEFARQLGAKTILERGKGHFSDGITSLPSACSALLKMSAHT